MAVARLLCDAVAAPPGTRTGERQEIAEPSPVPMFAVIDAYCSENPPARGIVKVNADRIDRLVEAMRQLVLFLRDDRINGDRRHASSSESSHARFVIPASIEGVTHNMR
jgi:hypothetical protein